MSLLVAPSILSADLTRLGAEVEALEAAGADLLHIDVMDGRFVPNLTFGPPVIRALRQVSRLPLEVHLMVESPERLVEGCIEAGAHTLIVHSEACVHLHRTLTHIRSLGAQVGVALNPATPAGALAHVLDIVDVVLVMSVNPGFAGQALIPNMLGKVAELTTVKKASTNTYSIEVDGGVTHEHIAAIARSGADRVVAGTAIFSTSDYRAAIAQLRAKA